MKTRFGFMALCLTCALIGSLITSAFAVQTHMWNALNNLKSARAQLVAAKPDKGGHRVNAIKLVDQAIAETNAGITAGK